MTTSSTSPGSIPARLTASLTEAAPSVAPARLLNPPRYALPMGVRAVDTITACFTGIFVLRVRLQQKFMWIFAALFRRRARNFIHTHPFDGAAPKTNPYLELHSTRLWQGYFDFPKLPRYFGIDLATPQVLFCVIGL